MLHRIFCLSCITCFTFSSLAQPGALDAAFGNNGLSTALPQPVFNKAYSVLVQPDNKILLAGYSIYGTDNVFSLTRLLPNGDPDMTFGNSGFVETPIGAGASCYAAILQPNGKILLAGTALAAPSGAADFAAVRYLPNGTLDSTFAGDGIQTISFGSGDELARAIALQPDGKIILGGYAYIGTLPDFALARYLDNGDLDPDFGDSGLVTTDFDNSYDYGFPLSFQPDGKLLLGGYSFSSGHTAFAVARYISGLKNVGVIDFSQELSGFIAPNPVGKEAAFSFELQQSGTFSLTLTDAQGRLVQTFFKNKRLAPGHQSEVLNFQSALPPGWYMLRLDDGARQVTVKVLKG